MRIHRPAAVLLVGLLLGGTSPTVASATPAKVPASATAAEGPGASGPDLSYENRSLPGPGLPDWSHAGYRGGLPLPDGEEDLTDLSSCRISPELLASKYEVVADDGADDTTGLQQAIDFVKKECSPLAGFNRRSLIELPAGRIDVTRQIYVDANFLTLRGKGADDGGTRLVFRPGLSTRYDQVAGGRWDQDSMTAGTGTDVGNGGWIWPGRGMFRVQTREVATRYQDDWEAASSLPMRKDLFEGSVNQHWVSGVKVLAADDDPGYSARQGGTVIRLDAKADMTRFRPGGYVWVGAANSKKFYEQQGITDPLMMEALHMRQQMFRLTRLDSTAKTITVDRPLEWDLPVDSESDGSAPINAGGKPYASKVTPLKVVEGVGFEDFAFTQDMNGLPKIGGQETYSLTPDQAKNNYGNMAPEYAMHGIVFKWAANSWVRGLKATMTGSHPIVTENARNLQIERNSFDGAWNKGKGGNGYLRGSRVWDSLWAHNQIRNLRHFTFQWSASGNVAFRNDLDADLNLHGGWEHKNLFEQNTVRIPYEHRSANCESNCGGEGGEIDEGTWYPIWWAAGPKAGKWSGSSGPQNVFYNNTLIKQTTPGGPFETYAPYGNRPGTAFEFGSDSDEPGQFEHLGQNGQGIADWTGRETTDFEGQGVATLDLGKRHSLFLKDTGGELDPRTRNARVAVTWNMHGAGISQANNGATKWDLGVRAIINAAEVVDVIALQEAGVPPGGVDQRHYTIPQPPATEQRPQYLVQEEDGRLVAPDVYEYPFGSETHPDGWLYWLRTDTRSNGAGQVNLAIWTRERVYDPETNPTAEGRVFVIPALSAPGQPTPGRPALGVRLGDTVYFTVHAQSPGGANAPTIANRVRTVMRTAGDTGGPLSSILMGDFNRSATELRSTLRTLHDVHSPPEPTFPVLPAPGQTGRTYDYAVVPRMSDPNLEIQVGAVGRLADVRYSDHFPVLFAFNEPATSQPPEPPRKSRKVPTGETKLLRNAKSGNAPYPSGRGSGGGSRLSVRGVERSSVGQQRFMLQPIPESPGHFALVHRMTYTYMGLEYGAANAPAVLLPEYEADSQLWTAVDMRDGTWVLQNAATGQVLSTADAEGDEELVGRDYDASDAAQRWFFQDATTEALDSDEIVREDIDPAEWAISARDGAAENAEVTMAPDGDQTDQRFTPIYADTVGDDYCYYILYEGKYLNTSTSQTSPTEGGVVRLNTFRPNDTYLWCMDMPDRHLNRTVYLTQHTNPEEKLYLTSFGVDGWKLSLTKDPATAERWLWKEVTE